MPIRRKRQSKSEDRADLATASNPFFVAVLFGVILATVGLLLSNWVARSNDAEACVDSGGCWDAFDGRCRSGDDSECGTR